jgi:signal transduction histidine kinase
MMIRDNTRIPLASGNPMAVALREALPQWWETSAALAQAYPDLRENIARVRREALAVIPLIAGETRVGGITVGFREQREFDATLRHFLVILARQCTLAVQRARAFEREREAREEAQRSNRIKTDFLARMSHELRTPLNAISGYAQLLEMEVHGPLTEWQRDALARIQRSQDHLLGLIDQLLTHSRLEANAITYELASVSLSAAIAEVRDIVTPLVGRKHLTFECSVPTDGVAVVADASRLRQILINLLTNAVKFTDARDGKTGRIEIWCAMDNGAAGAGHERSVRIHVRDNGPGVPPSDLERIFEPFIQGDESLTRAVGGVGLGLAISRELARAMGGDLTVESTAGEGSVFTLSLPVAVVPATPRDSVATSLDAPALGA